MASSAFPEPISGIKESLLDAAGDILYASSDNTPARLGIGSSAQVLTVASGVPSWATPASSTPTFVGALATSRSSVSVAHIAFTKIPLATQIYSTNSIHSASVNNTRFTIPSGKGGYWTFYATLGFDPLPSGNFNFRFLKNNNAYTGGIYYGGSTSSTTLSTGSITTILYLDAGDYIELQVYQNSGGNASTLVSGGEDFLFMGCNYLGA